LRSTAKERQGAVAQIFGRADGYFVGRLEFVFGR